MLPASWRLIRTSSSLAMRIGPSNVASEGRPRRPLFATKSNTFLRPKRSTTGAVGSGGAIRVTHVRATSRRRLWPAVGAPALVDGVPPGRVLRQLVSRATRRLLMTKQGAAFASALIVAVPIDICARSISLADRPSGFSGWRGGALYPLAGGASAGDLFFMMAALAAGSELSGRLRGDRFASAW